MRRVVDAVGLEGLIAGSAKPMTKVRGQHQGHARLQLHELVVTLQPSLAIALQYRDCLKVGMRVSGGFVPGRRSLNADADRRRAFCVADKRQIGRSAFERLRCDVAVAHNWHCLLSHNLGRSRQLWVGGSIHRRSYPIIARTSGCRPENEGNTSLANGAGQGTGGSKRAWVALS